MRNKIIILLWIVLGIHSIQSQNLYEIHVYDLHYTVTHNVKNNTSSNITITIEYEDGGTPDEIYYNAIRDGSNERDREVRKFQTDRKPVRIKTRVFINFIGSRFDINGTEKFEDIATPCNTEKTFIRDTEDNRFGRGLPDFRYRYTIRPIIDIPEPSYRIIGYDDFHTISATSGLPNNLYNWQYATVKSGSFYNWRSLPVSNSSTVSFRPRDFLSSSLIGRDIYFRAVSCTTDYDSNPVRYTLSRSAPNITRVTSTANSCYDKNDGTITVQFNRALIRGENLSIAVEDMSLPSIGVHENGNPSYPLVPGIEGTNNITSFDANHRVTLTKVTPSTTRYQIVLGGSFTSSTTNGRIALYTGGAGHFGRVSVTRRPKVVFATEPNDGVTDVFCHGGDDGVISFTAGGGVGGYHYLIRKKGDLWPDDWTPFRSNPVRIGGLSKGDYEIKLKDRNDCVAVVTKIVGGKIEAGEEIIKEATVGEPAAPLSVTFDTDESKDPRAFGFTDGVIVAHVTGGTSDNGVYNFEWKDEAGTVLTNTEGRVLPAPDNRYQIMLNGLPKGKYYLTVWDRNYNAATYKTTCVVADAVYELDEPDPLVLTIEETHDISCNNANLYGDEFSDGELVAHAIGGIQLDPLDNLGLPYYYSWKKQDPNTGLWQDLAVTDSIAPNLDTGTYAVNIQDANGIILGDYEDNILVRERDTTYFLKQPTLLQVSFRKEDIVCNSGMNGVAEALISGGTPPYEISWSTGATTAIIEELIAGKYTVFVSDSKGCRVSGTVLIEQPNGLKAVITDQKDPTCYQGADGYIQLTTQGGTPPYTFLWDTGETTESISGLTEGMYLLEITDAEGCIAYEEFTLTDPDPVVVDLGGDRALCMGQSLPLDIGIDDPGTTYLWQSDNGYSSTDASVVLTQSGTYTATLTTSLGCIGIHTITVTTSDTEIDADFLLFSQAFTGNEVTMVNVSLPDGDKVVWTLPDDESIEVVSQDAERLVVVFKNKGSYDFYLRTYQGDCYADYKKTVLVEEASNLPNVGDASNPFIEEFLVYPNPTDGNFTVKVVLAEAASIAMRVFNLTHNKVAYEYQEDGQKEYEIPVNMTVSSGAYVLVLETPKGDEIRKIIIE
ncbi:T9SS type A sorting domain-containing protein [Aquimarina sp. 2201CG1-2-11]|uniref:T9SS type A sorting domain-containing protein n=1 Tax=Aquimarina discodermiae TaxID=3231043 RepID=UPI003461E5A5